MSSGFPPSDERCRRSRETGRHQPRGRVEIGSSLGWEGDVSPLDPAELRRIDLLTDVPTDLIERLAERAESVLFEQGAELCREGTVVDAVLLLTSGSTRLCRTDADGRDVDMGVVREGASIGELSLLSGTPHPATARARERTQAIRLRKELLDELMPTHPQLLQILARSASRFTQGLQEDIVGSTDRLRETQYEIIFRLGRAAEFRDDDTGVHITRMSRFAARVALELGFSKERTELLLHAAPMHDIGKIGIPDDILLKPGKLTDEEFDIMKTHTEIGAELLAGSASPVVQLAQQVALSHHEKWNGSGYPEGIEGENIPLEARICCVVDVFDALISERPYKQPWSVDDALAEIKKCGGTMFDPEIVDLFISLEDDVRGILERTTPTSSVPSVSRSATMYFLTRQAGATP